MRRTASLLLAFLLLALAAGAEAKTFVYVYDGSNELDADPKIYGFVSNGGLVSALPGSPFDVPDGFVDCLGQCQSLEYVKKRKTLVVSGPTGISSFVVEKDGSLTAVAGSPFGGTLPLSGVGTVQVGSRAFVYSPEFASGALHAFEVAATGTLTPVANSPFDTDLHAPAGVLGRKRLLFIADQAIEDPAPAPNGLGVFTIGDDGTPTAAPGSPVEIVGGNFSYTVASDTAGKFVYLADDATKTEPIRVHAFAIDKKTGAPTLVPGSPFDTILPDEFATGVSVSKGLVAALDLDSQDLALFRTAKDGSLTPLGTLEDTGANARVHTLSKFLYIASEFSVQVVAIRKRDGATDRAPLVPFREDDVPINPVGIAVLNR